MDTLTAWAADGKTVVKHEGLFKPHEIVSWKEAIELDQMIITRSLRNEQR